MLVCAYNPHMKNQDIINEFDGWNKVKIDFDDADYQRIKEGFLKLYE